MLKKSKIYVKQKSKLVAQLQKKAKRIFNLFLKKKTRPEFLTRKIPQAKNKYPFFEEDSVSDYCSMRYLCCVEMFCENGMRLIMSLINE